MGQMGFSVAIANNNKEMIVGAPGVSFGFDKYPSH